MERETLFIIGESRTNLDNAITKIYGSFYMAFEVVSESGEIVDLDCSHTLELTRDFMRRMFLHKRMLKDAELLEAEIMRRYHGSSARAILVAYRDAAKRFQKLCEPGQ